MMLNKDNVKLGIAPIGWTNDDMPDLGKENTFEQCISEMALAGFTGTEVGNKYPRDTDVLKRALKLREMQIAGAWFSAFLTTDDYEATEKRFIKHCDFLHEMGADVVVVSEQGHSIQGLQNPVFDDKPYFTDEEWMSLANGLNKLGKLAQDKGMKLVYHHHMGTGVQTAIEIDQLMELTDENHVYLLFDTGHLYLSGEDPIKVLKKYSSRVKHVHLKDVRDEVRELAKNEKMSFLSSVREGVFTVPGDGSYDFTDVFSYLEDMDYKGWMIVEAEQDPEKANPFEYALKARKYIKKKVGV